MPKRKSVDDHPVQPDEEDHDGSDSSSGSDDSEDASAKGSGSESLSNDEGDDGFPEVSDEDNDSDEDDDGTKTMEDGEKQITIEFEFFQPKEIDFHGLKSLLSNYLDGMQYDSSGLVNAVLKQAQVGSVVKTSEEDDPIAVFTVMSTSIHKGDEWLQQLTSFLAKKCVDNPSKERLEQALDQEGTGLLLTERLINCPPKLAPPLMQFLFEEIKEAASGNLGLQKKVQESFRFKRYIIATRVFADNERTAAGGYNKKAKTRMGPPPSASNSAAVDPVIVYLRPEDEFLHKHCTWSYTFPVEGRIVGKDDLQPLRMVMMIDASKIAAVRKGLDSVVGNMAAE